MSKQVEFNFIISRADGQDIPKKQLNKLMQLFVDTLQKEGMQLGGEYLLQPGRLLSWVPANRGEGTALDVVEIGDA